MVSSFDCNNDVLNILAGVVQDVLAPYFFILCRDYALRTSTDLIKGNCFILKMARTRRYPVETMRDADSTDDLAFLANTPA